jgi:hypothetical protein
MVGLLRDGVSYYESSPGVMPSTSCEYSTKLWVLGASVADVNAGSAIIDQLYSATFTASSTHEPAS